MFEHSKKRLVVTEQRRIPHFALSHASHSNIPQAFDTTNVMELY